MPDKPLSYTDRFRTLFPTEPGTMAFKQPGTGTELFRLPVNQTPAPLPAEAPGTVESAFKRGGLNTASNFATSGGLIAEAFGNDEFARAFYDKADEYKNRSEAFQPTIGGIENIHSLADVAVFGLEVLVENAPMLASMAIPGGAVTIGARMLGAGAGAAATLGSSAAFLSNVGIQTGESGTIAREGGVSPVDMRVVGSGLGKAALDFVPVLGVAKRLGLVKNLPLPAFMEKVIVGKLAEGGFIRRAAGNAAAIVAREVPTEVAQEAINIAVQRSIQEYGGDLTDEEKSQLLNAAAGATVFGILGIPAGLRKPVVANEGPGLGDDVTPPGVDVDPGQTAAAVDASIESFNTDLGVGGDAVDLTGIDAVGGVVIDNVEAIATLAEPTTPISAELPGLEPVAPEIDNRAATERALVQEPATVNTTVVLDNDGALTMRAPVDPILEKETGTDPISIGLNRTAEQLEVVGRYPQYEALDPQSPEAQNIAALHPGLQRLLDLKAEVLADEENYRTTDGLLKKASQTRVDVLGQRINALQERLGITPVDLQSQPLTEKAVVENAAPVTPAAPVLSESQAIRLEALSEKEQLEGLTEREFETFHELQQIAVGAVAPAETMEESTESRAANATELESIAQEVISEETVKTSSTNTRYKTGEWGKGIKLETAAKMINQFRKGMKVGPRVRVVSREHKEAQANRRWHGREMFGWWDVKSPGEIVIVADNHHTPSDLLRTYLHESLSHYGLRTILTEKELTDVLKSLIDSPPGNIILSTNPETLMNLERGRIDQKLLNDAEEYIARIAETAILDPNSKVIQQAWWKRLQAYIRRAARRLMPSIRFTDNDLLFMLRDVSKVFTGGITQRYQPGVDNHLDRKSLARVVGDEIAERASNDLDSILGVYGAKYRKMFFTPLQFAARYQVDGSREFLEFVQQWWARKRTISDDATVLAGEIQRYGARDQQKLSQATLGIGIKSDEVARRLTHGELQEQFTEAGIQDAPALVRLWERLDKTFQTSLQQFRTAQEKIAIRIKGKRGEVKRSKEETDSLHRQWQKARLGTPTERSNFVTEVGWPTYLRLKEIGEELNPLENRNYFPRMRFGQHTVTIRAKKDLTFEGKVYKGPTNTERGEVVYFETFESDRALQAGFNDLKKSFHEGTYQMQAGKLTDQEFHFMGTMSPDLYEKIVSNIPDATNDAEQGLTDQMRENLRELYLRQAPGRSFLKHLTKRKGVAGYSEDMLRVFATYHMNISNHIARLEYHIDMNEQLDVIDKNAANKTPDARVSAIVRDYFRAQYDYIMNPKNDLASVRAFGFLWYLGGNVKSAVVNLTQVPMVAYPYLASRYGDVKSSAALLDGLRLVTANRVGGQVYSEEISKAVDRAVKEGFVEESRATEMAAIAENHVLQRLIPSTRSGKILADTSYYASWMFSKAERVNREITFIAAYKLAKDNGVVDEEAAFMAGRQAVQTAMFEYAKWNRPAFMRGKKSVAFLFWQFMQGMAYIGFGGAGMGSAMRVWATLALAGGLQGLPFAENMLDLLDFLGTKAKEQMGLKDPKVDLRADLRELAQVITDRPDLVMHGLSRYYGLGPLHALQMIGIPVPNVDISGSISAGRVIPGTDELGSADRDPNAQLGRALADIAGPVAAIPYNMLRWATDTNPDQWKRWERVMPVAMANVSKGLRRSNIDIGPLQGRGQEEFRGGGAQTQFDPQDMEHRAELLAQSLGFATTRVNQRYEADFAVTRMAQYWTLRRALVMENVAYARMAGDREVIKDSMDALKRFNSNVPAGALRINSTQLLQSLEQRFRRATLRERGIPSQLLFRRISRDMRELYPESAAEIE